ncbi:hypothetical protein P3342_013185 [Pyrenophora teres f. teres]|nr:hypothetical protein P3342_013185 [Pyrenophora teres f. teres]
MTHPETARSHFLAPYHCDFVSTDCKVGYHKYDLQEPFSHCASCAMLHGLDLDPDSRPVTYYPPTEHFEIDYVGARGYERVVKREGAGCDGDGEAVAEAEVEARVEAVVGIEEEKEEGGEVDEEEEEYCGSMRSWGSLSDVDSVTSHWRLDDQISQVAARYHAYQYANYQSAPVFPAYGNQNPAFYPTQDHHHSPQQHQEPAFSLLPNQLGGAVFPTHGIQNQAFYAQHTPHHSPLSTKDPHSRRLKIRKVIRYSRYMLAQLSHHITESRQNSPPKLQPAVFNTTAPAFRFPEAAGQGQGVGGTGGAGMFAGLYTPPPAPSQPLDAGLYAPSAYTSPVRGGGRGGGVGVFQGPSVPQTQVQAHSSGTTTNASITPVFTFNTGVRYTHNLRPMRPQSSSKMS